jgi:hypothetical protein
MTLASRTAVIIGTLLIGILSLPLQWLLAPWVPWTLWASLFGFFLLFTWVLLWIAHRLIRHPNAQLFTAFTLGAVLGKLMLCLFFVWLLLRVFTPDTRHFLVHFFYFYLGFTVVEIGHMIRLIRLDAQRRPHTKRQVNEV